MTVLRDALARASRLGSRMGRTGARSRDAAARERLEAIERRVEHLEAMLEGLQDAVHREWVRQGREIDQLHRQVEPAELRRVLSRDARDHGL
jgi:hypothetical protein